MRRGNGYRKKKKVSKKCRGNVQTAEEVRESKKSVLACLKRSVGRCEHEDRDDHMEKKRR